MRDITLGITIFVESIIGHIIISHGILNADVLWGCTLSIVFKLGQELDYYMKLNPWLKLLLKLVQ